MAEELPLILSGGTNSYIYGPAGLPTEQISSGGTVSYLHHDQQGSTRLLTGSTGTVTGKCTYGAYGTPTCEGATTTPLGYDGQYTSSDTGLIYLRTRVYDPATAQFLTVDPLVRVTRALYTYGQDNPLNRADLTGLCTGFGPAPAGCTGGSGELGPHVFCESNKQETEQREKEERVHREEREIKEKEERELQNCGRVEASYGGPPSSVCQSTEGEGPAEGGDGPVVPLPPPGGQPGVPGIKVPTLPFPEGGSDPVPAY
jgi:RHS repeat-associated protein